MHDLDVHAADIGDLDRLFERFQHLVRFIAQVREVAGVVALDRVAQRDHLVRPRVGAGRGEQPRRKAECAGFERLVQERDHALQFVRGRRPVRHAHHHQAQRVVADQHAGIHRGRRERVEVVGKGGFAKRQPRRARAEIVAQQFDLARQRRCDREAAVPDDFGGYALAHLALGLGIDRQGEVGMGLDVDEAGRNRETIGLDHLRGARRRARFRRVSGARTYRVAALAARFARQRGATVELRADSSDAAIANGEIAGLARDAGAVEQHAAADQDVEGHGHLDYAVNRAQTWFVSAPY